MNLIMSLTARSGAPEKFTFEKKVLALESYAAEGARIKAAEAAGVHPKTLARHLKKDPEFLEAWELADEAFVESLRAADWERAVNGTLVEKFDRSGNLQSRTRSYSDGLLLALLKAHAPKIFGDKKSIETKTTVSHEHQLTLDVSQLDSEQRDAMRKLLGRGGSVVGDN